MAIKWLRPVAEFVIVIETKQYVCTIRWFGIKNERLRSLHWNWSLSLLVFIVVLWR